MGISPDAINMPSDGRELFSWATDRKRPGQEFPGGSVFAIRGEGRGEKLQVCDLRNRTHLQALLDSVEPDCVVHLAAYRDPDFREEHPEEAFALNVEPTWMFCELLPVDVPLLFVSPDYVFDGKSLPYLETDPVAPVNVTGRAK